MIFWRQSLVSFLLTLAITAQAQPVETTDLAEFEPGDGSIRQDVGKLLIIDSKILFRGQEVFADGFE